MEETYAISLGNSWKGNPVELHQISLPEGIWKPRGIASGTVIVHKKENQSIPLGLNHDIVRHQIAMNKPGLMQTANFRGKLSEIFPFLL
tara:strand:- start:125 stop:391 length:267 start_codon:yes stop_codon:yes gene_type:complete